MASSESSKTPPAASPVRVTSFNLEFAGRRARLGVIEDLTERLMAEERAKQSEQRYHELLQQRSGTPE
jgi:PAS domain-containing protein